MNKIELKHSSWVTFNETLVRDNTKAGFMLLGISSKEQADPEVCKIWPSSVAYYVGPPCSYFFLFFWFFSISLRFPCRILLEVLLQLCISLNWIHIIISMALPYQKSTTGGLCSQNKKTLCQLLFCFACTIGLRYTLTFQWCIMCARINKSLIRPEVDYDIIQYCRPILHFAKELSYRPILIRIFMVFRKRLHGFLRPGFLLQQLVLLAMQLSPLIRWPVWFNRLPCRPLGLDVFGCGNRGIVCIWYWSTQLCRSVIVILFHNYYLFHFSIKQNKTKSN